MNCPRFTKLRFQHSIDYALSIWGNCNEYIKNMIFRLQKRASRIAKNNKKSLCDSDNYQPIALSGGIFGKTFVWVILLKEKDTHCSSDMQFGFKEGLSTTGCTFTMLETISYDNFNHTNVYALFLDAMKVFECIMVNSSKKCVNKICIF